MEPHDGDRTGLTGGAAESPVTVFIIDADADHRAAIARLLEFTGTESREYSSLPAFLDDYRPNQPGCVICDLRLVDGDVELCNRLAAAARNLPIIFTASFGDVPTALRVMSLARVEILEKLVPQQRLLEVIQRLMADDSVRRRELARWNEVAARIDSLTDKERDVLHMIMDGAPNKAIASKVEITERAVEMRRASVMKKLQVHSLAELICTVTRHQVIAELWGKILH